MTIKELTEAVHSAFYRIVRQVNPMPIEDFLKNTIEETWPQEQSPSGWPDFWWESMAVEIQSAVMTRREYILDFNAKLLKESKTMTWEELINYIFNKLGPIV